MCQSKSQGGRRCSGRSGDTSTSAPASTAVLAREQSGTPSRQQADDLAEAMAADSSGWDGQPLDAAGRRLYALRDSGYSGPIDQDGYPDTTSDAAGTLRRMAERRGETPNW